MNLLARVGIGCFCVISLAANLPGQQFRLPNVDLSMNNGDFQSPALCELSCFAATYRFSTVPYYSLDQPRNVTLIYNGDQAFPRPFIYADVDGGYATDPNGIPVAVTRYTMSATLNGAAVTFLNGQTLLTFTGSQPYSPVRLAGQFDARSYATNVYPLLVTVRATYADGGIGEAAGYGTDMMIVNEAGSEIAKGWTVAGLQRVRQTISGGYMITNGDGSATRFDALGVKAADFTTLTYTSVGSYYTRTYPNGSQAVFNSVGQQTKFVEHGGRTSTFGYDPFGRIQDIRDPYRKQPNGNVTSIGLSYDGNGLRMIQEPSADGTQWSGRVTWFLVDGNRCMSYAQDPDGVATNFTCDANGRLSTITDRRGSVTSLVYDAFSWKLSTVQLPSVPVDAGNGATTLKSPAINYSPWQTQGVPTSTTSKSSPWTAPSAANVMGRITDPAGRITSFKPNRFGQGIEITDPVGRRTLMTTTLGYLPRRITHPNGGVDTLSYDAFGRLKISHPAGERYTSHVWTGGLLTSIGGPGARTQYWSYNSTNQLNHISFGFNPAQTLTYTYDPATRRVASIRDNSGHTTTFTYDPRFGNLQQTTMPGNRTTSKVFDALGRDSVTTEPMIASRSTLYDGMNRPTSTSAAGSTTTLTYDQLFQTDVYDASGNHSHTDYNALGWPTRACDASNLCATTRYDKSGSVTSRTNRRNQILDFTRDGAGRVLSQSGAGTITSNYSYAADGRSMVAWNTIQRDSIFFNPGSQTLAPSDSVVTWIDGKRFRVSHRKARAVSDTALTSIISNTGVTFYDRKAIYSPSGFLISLHIGGTGIPFSVDSDGTGGTNSIPTGGTRTSHATATHATADIAFSNTNLNASFRRQYHYDGAGRIDQVMSGYLNSFGYDSLGRLSQRTARAGCFYYTWPSDTISGPFTYCAGGLTVNETFAYDATGNRVDQGGVPTTGNRYLYFKGTSYFYDADGNVIQKYNNNGLYNYEWFWNARGQLDSVTKDSWHKTSFDYNALGKPVRIWNGDPNGRTLGRYLVWDGNALVAEFWPNGQRDLDYIYLPGTIDRPFAATQGATTPTSIRMQELDELQNVIGTHRHGSVTQSNSYDPWGKLTSTNSDSHLQWKGTFWNGEATGLNFMRNRWYDPEGGRFVNEDPAGLNGGINPYAFAANDPVNGIDPSGLANDCGWQHWQSSRTVPNSQPGWLATVVVESHREWVCTPGPGPVSIGQQTGGGGPRPEGFPEDKTIDLRQCGIAGGNLLMTGVSDYFGVTALRGGVVLGRGALNSAVLYYEKTVFRDAGVIGKGRFARVAGPLRDQTFAMAGASTMGVAEVGYGLPHAAELANAMGDIGIWDFVPVVATGRAAVKTFQACIEGQ